MFSWKAGPALRPGVKIRDMMRAETNRSKMASFTPKNPKKTKGRRDTPSGSKVRMLANAADRFALMQALTPRVPLGTRRCADSAKIGPAHAEKCLMPLAEWKKTVASREGAGRCKGIFFASFGRTHLFRRCDAATDDDLCALCDQMEKAAATSPEKTVSVKGLQAYEVISKSLFSREGVKAAMAFWKAESKAVVAGEKQRSGFPYFEAKKVVSMLMLDGGAVFPDGGRGGRTYKRSAIIVEAQDKYVRVCMAAMLSIVQVENRDRFLRRWKAVLKAAKEIHVQMAAEAHRRGDALGALQAPDVIQEELVRAGTYAASSRKSAAFVSVRVKRLVQWARKRKHGDSRDSSPSSLSSSLSPQQRISPPRVSQAPQLQFEKVPPETRENPSTEPKKRKLARPGFYEKQLHPGGAEDGAAKRVSDAGVSPGGNDGTGSDGVNAGAEDKSREEVLPPSDSVGSDDANAGAAKDKREEVLPRGDDNTGSDEVNAGAEDDSREEVLPRDDSVGSDDANAGAAKTKREEVLPRENDRTGSDVVNAGAEDDSREEILPRTDSVGPDDVNAGAAKNNREEVLPRDDDDADSGDVDADVSANDSERASPRGANMGSDSASGRATSKRSAKSPRGAGRGSGRGGGRGAGRGKGRGRERGSGVVRKPASATVRRVTPSVSKATRMMTVSQYLRELQQTKKFASVAHRRYEGYVTSEMQDDDRTRPRGAWEHLARTIAKDRAQVPTCSEPNCAKPCGAKRIGTGYYGTCWEHRPSSQMEAEAPICAVVGCAKQCGVRANGKGYFSTCFQHKQSKTKVPKLSEPVHKKFEVRESNVRDAGRGLFITEKATDGEQIARYSGAVMSRTEAEKVVSDRKLSITGGLVLVADETRDWEGQFIVCARKGNLKVNARIPASARLQTCPVSGRHYVPILAVGTIYPHSELAMDYRNEYWKNPDGTLEDLQSPDLNDEASSGLEKDRESDSDYSPGRTAPGPVREEAVRTRSVSRRDSRQQRSVQSGTQAHSKTGNNTQTTLFLTPAAGAHNGQSGEKGAGDDGASERLNGENSVDPLVTSQRQSSDGPVWAVARGRCVGLFRSAMRVSASTFEYTGNKVRKCASVAQAEAYMAQHGFQHPRKYWEDTYASGSLLEQPAAVIGRKVSFPVGHDQEFYMTHGTGTVDRTMIRHDARMWSVVMMDGSESTMSEWPLLCGLAQYALVHNPGAHARSSTSKLFAVRGTVNDGVIRDIRELPARLVGPKPEVREFGSDAAARAWINEVHVKNGEGPAGGQFYAIRGGDRDGVVRNIADVGTRLTGGAVFDVFTSESDARAWLAAADFFAVRFAGGQQQVMSASEFIQEARGQVGVRSAGPYTMAKAKQQLVQWEASSEAPGARRANVPECGAADASRGASRDAGGATCIAVCRDGSVCARTTGITATLLGPLCGDHAILCRYVNDLDEQKEGPSHTRARESERNDGLAEHGSSSAGPSGQNLRSPDTSIQLPEAKDAIAKEKTGKFAVIALRTFPDEKCPAEPAGSVWLTFSDAEAANKQHGEMKLFNKVQDICANIADAREWIEQQVASDAAAEAEFETRMQRAREQRSSTAPTAASTAGGGGDPGDDPGDDPSDDGSDHDYSEPPDDSRGAPGSRFRRSQRQKGSGSRGGLRSGASVLLDKEQAKIKKMLFPANADPVLVYENDVPIMRQVLRIPLPGTPGALTTDKSNKHVISFSNNMEAVLEEKKFKSFDAFSLSQLMEFQQTVEYVAEYLPDDMHDVAESVVAGVRVIVRNAVQVHAAMRDSDSLGPHGVNFKSNVYTQIMYMAMFREVFDGTMSHMFWWTYSMKFSAKASGCAGMGPSKKDHGSGGSGASSSGRCLVCGEAGHTAASDVHQDDMAEGGMAYSQGQLRKALATVASDTTLTAESKKHWSGRIKKYWAALERGGGGVAGGDS